MNSKLAEQWDYERNELDISKVSIGSGKACHWKCTKCGYRWTAKPSKRKDTSYSCPHCELHYVAIPGEDDVLTLYPKIQESYDFEKNPDIELSILTPFSNKRVHWRCPRCNYEFIQAIKPRIQADFKCPCCDLNRVVKSGFNDVITEHPKILDFFDRAENPDIDLSKLPSHSTKQVWWKCNRCGYSWQSSIKSRANTKMQCPCCELGLAVKPGWNDAFTLIPDLENWIDPEKNSEIDPRSLAINSKVKLWWICPECGNNFQSLIIDRVNKLSDGSYVVIRCRNCFETRPKTPVSAVAKLVKFWDYKKNREAGLDINLVPSQSEKPAHWHCNECGYNWTASPKSRMYVLAQCPSCESLCSVQKGVNDLLTIVPEAAKTYDFEKNAANGIDVYSLGSHSSTLVSWKCPNCGNAWDQRVVSRIRTRSDGTYQITGCQNCDSRLRRNLTYAEQYPDLIPLFDVETNKRTLDSVTSSESSSKKFWWICETCGNRFASRLITMITGLHSPYRGCPYCSKKLYNDSQPSFADVHPELLSEYSPENTIDPHKVYPSSKKAARWICDNDPQHQWIATFASRHAGFGSCPICRNRYVIPGVNSFADKFPELMEYWSPRNTKKPTDVLYNSREWYFWVCPNCSEEYGTTPLDFVNKDNTCPYCTNRRVLSGFNSLADKYPTISNTWSPDNNRSPNTLLPTSGYLAKWICPDCCNQYRGRVRDMVQGTISCPFCEGTRIDPTRTSLKALYPSIAENWSSNNITSSDRVSPTSRTRVKWVCPDCRQEYEDLICNQVNGDASCPYCNNRLPLPGFNTLQAKYPDVAKLWSPDNIRTADQVLPSTTVRFRWECPTCKASYYATIRDQVEGKALCPYCTDRKALPGYNSFAIRYPELVDEWYFLCNYALADPDEILPNSILKVWWICPNNPAHHYPMTVTQRVTLFKRGRESCPYCKGRRINRRHFI